jgi:endonuclease/exonuclease/phosphatase (EEP) superfamily protein YafD
LEVTEFKTQKIRLGELSLNNKGSIGMSMVIQGSRFLFVNNHLTTHSVEKRNQDYSKIIKELSIEDYDTLFFFGDFNYRINGTATVIHNLIQDHRMEVLEANDQLNIERKKQNCFQGFDEALITFMPTYKWDRHSHHYDLSRSPSWTDRILYKGAKISCLRYYSTDCLGSDHRPVYGLFLCE